VSQSTTHEGQGLVGVAFVVALVALLGPLALPMRPSMSVVLGSLAIVLGLFGGGFRGLGIAAILLGGYVVVSVAVGGFLLGAAQQGSFDEPVPVPSGYGLEGWRDDALVRAYHSERVSDRSEAGRMANDIVDAYASSLEREGWRILEHTSDKLGASLMAREPSSDRTIRVHAQVVMPDGPTGTMYAVDFQIGNAHCELSPLC
jgi:hypothetical protein